MGACFYHWGDVIADECHGDQCRPICHENSQILGTQGPSIFIHRYGDLSILGHRTIESYLDGVE